MMTKDGVLYLQLAITDGSGCITSHKWLWRILRQGYWQRVRHRTTHSIHELFDEGRRRGMFADSGVSVHLLRDTAGTETL